MKRFSLRSITASRSIFGTPATWLRKPSSLYSCIARIPLRPSRSALATVSCSLPRHDTMPIPVTTTRRISETLGRLEQAHAHVAPDVDLVAHQLRGRLHLAGKLHVAHAQRTAGTGLAQPWQEEATELPHRIQAQAAGHHRIADEVATEKPQVRTDIQLGMDQTLAVGTALLRDPRDAVEHQHRWRRQAGIAVAEKLAAAAGTQLFVIERGGTRHRKSTR